MRKIPIHNLADRTSLGIEIRHVSFPNVRDELEKFEVHRDDMYIFILIERGHGSITVDFVDIQLSGRNLYFIAPGQVHFNIQTNNSQFWSLAVNPALIGKELLDAFRNQLGQQNPQPLFEFQYTQCRQLLEMLYAQIRANHKGNFAKNITQALLHAALSTMANAYEVASTVPDETSSRTVTITRDFRQLLSKHITSEKSPSFYAQELYISEAYLNEAVKKMTGFTITYWIANEVILEAKRLLAHSNLGIKEIAFSLGYEDHAYFSRLFKKNTQMSPQAFRSDYLK